MDDDREQPERRTFVGFEKRQQFLELQNAFLSLKCPPDRLGNEQYGHLMRLSAVVGRLRILTISIVYLRTAE